MKKVRMLMKKVVVGFIALAMVVTSFDLSVLKVHAADPHYTGGYSIEEILSQYEYFVKGNLNLGCHTVGSVVAGGEFGYSNEAVFGDAAQYPSYLGKPLSVRYAFNDFGGIPVANKTIYYNDSSADPSTWISWGGTANAVYVSEPYFDFSKLSAMNTQAKAIAGAATKVSASDLNSSGILEIDLSKTPNVDIPYSLYSSSDFHGINFVGVSGAQDFSDNVYSVSISGAGANTVTLNGGADIKVNGSFINSYMHILGSTANGDAQIFMGGFNFVWLFPDATGTINAKEMAGHIVAPAAHVSMTNGNFEGGVIAASAESDGFGEGHFYPFNPLKSIPTGKYAKIKGLKTDDDTAHNPVEGAIFGLYSNSDCTSEIKTATTGADGTFLFDGIDTTDADVTVYVKEKTAPKGYKLNTTKYKVVLPKGSTGTFKVNGDEPIIDERTKAGIKGLKVDDSATPVKLKNAVFGLYSDSACTIEITTATTDANGEFVFTDIDSSKDKTLYVKEKSAPAGYQINETVYPVSIEKGYEGIYEVNSGSGIVNKKNVVNLKGYKTDDSSVKLKGAKFGLYSDSGCTALLKEALSGEDGYFTFEEIDASKAGTYYVKEISAPEGYEKNTTKYTVTVNVGDTGTIQINGGNAIVNNKRNGLSLVGKKIDNETTDPLKNAVFGVWKNSGCTGTAIATATSGADGKFTFALGSDVHVGNTLYVKEITPPEGYDLNNTIYTALITTSGVNSINSGIAIPNTKTVKKVRIEGLKKGKDSGAADSKAAALKNAGFTLYASDKTTVVKAEVRSGDTGKFTFADIAVGDGNVTYYVKETRIPDGYKSPSTEWMMVTVPASSANGSVIKVNGGAAIINEKNPAGDADIHKSDESGKELKDAKIEITCKDSSVNLSKVTRRAGSGGADFKATKSKVSWTSTGEMVKLTGLPSGVYVMHEDMAPAGYELAADVVFKMKDGLMYDENDKPISAIVMVDASMSDPNPKYCSLAGIKTDEDGNVLKGATIGLYSDSACNKRIAKETSDNSGVFKFSKILPGTYYVKEISAPSGYKKSSKVYGPYELKDGESFSMNENIVNKKSDKPKDGGNKDSGKKGGNNGGNGGSNGGNGGSNGGNGGSNGGNNGLNGGNDGGTDISDADVSTTAVKTNTNSSTTSTNTNTANASSKDMVNSSANVTANSSKIGMMAEGQLTSPKTGEETSAAWLIGGSGFVLLAGAYMFLSKKKKTDAVK